ncbi:MAG: glyoxylate/hydroxypyruvate reductase A [Reyranella sp.]|uniref:2-hydroxyacid dehydrogenase n=1 Tax=Reyranella sp. TaxID=1929291 RepID=UPI002730ADB3|nr:glyoxylate/hydroxypyruvate reductase A [Reyranella sp.]MDP1966327.1 glyoxylate/hydroxypyruvate reductase A [Reyranella sp.]MDP2372892.1 glyoxylate/hydroxypyruvate reductase A [Reyranella sp.]
MPDAIAYISRDTDGVLWKKTLEAALGPLDFRTLDALGDKADIEVALAWKPPAGLIASFPNVKMIVSLGMGVDHLLADDKLPAGVPITRIMDDGLVGQMSEYAIYWALRHHRDIDKYAASQRAKQWKVEDFIDTIHRRIGILGLGTIGQDTAKKIAALGFPTAGWSRTQKTLPGIETFHGPDGLGRLLARSDILVNVLPLTRDTKGLLDARLFAVLPKGAYLINMARGGHVVDEALLAALDSGHLSGAALDVFNTEPLPPEHRYWTHPKVQVTPHIAGATNPRTASPGVIENIKNLRAGKPLINTVDAKSGY